MRFMTSSVYWLIRSNRLALVAALLVSCGAAVMPRSYFFFQAEDGIRHVRVTGVQTCALPIYPCQKSAVQHPGGFQEWLRIGLAGEPCETILRNKRCQPR